MTEYSIQKYCDDRDITDLIRNLMLAEFELNYTKWKDEKAVGILFINLIWK
jgi:hypothetical protein